jgi:SP family facilitated glucose transporter-like MFS transporter 3
MGRKQLLLISIGGILVSLLLAGTGLNTGSVKLSSVAITTFVMFVHGDSTGISLL